MSAIDEVSEIVSEPVLGEDVAVEPMEEEDVKEIEDSHFEIIILKEQAEILDVLQHYSKPVEEQEAVIVASQKEVDKLEQSILFQKGDVDVISLVNAKRRVLKRQKRLLRARLSKFIDLVSK